MVSDTDGSAAPALAPPRSLWLEWLILAAVIFVALILSLDRLFVNLSTHLPGTTRLDSADALWHMWWTSTGFAQSDGLIFNAWAGAPFQSSHLANLPILQAQIYRVITSLTSPVLALNMILVFSQAATHLALFFFFRRHARSVLIAALASTAFILSPWYVDLLAAADLTAIGLWPLPLALLAWDRWLEQPTPRRIALVALILVAALLSGTIHLAWIIALFIPYVLWTARPQRERLRTDTAIRDQLTFAGFALLIALLIYPLPAVIGSLLGTEPPFGPPGIARRVEQSSFVGSTLDTGPLILLTAALTLALLKESRKYALWLVAGGLFFLIGVHLIPDPWRMFAGAFSLPYQPLYPDSIFLGLSLFALLTVMVSHWGDALTARPAWQIAAALGGLALAVIGTSPATFSALPIQPVDPDPIYADIAAEPEDYLILSYPFGLSSRADDRALGEGADLALYAPYHHKRLLSGIAPYYDPLLLSRFSDMPFLLIDESTPDSRAAEALVEAVNTWRIGYVFVYRDRLSSSEISDLETLFEEAAVLCPPITRDSLDVYRARWHPLGC